MPTRNRWTAFTLTGLFLAAAASLAYAAVSEEAAAGRTASETDAGAGAADADTPQVRHSRIKLVLDHDGAAEQLEIADLHEMAVGESRELTTASGTPVVVTRDDAGFEIDLDGKKIRLADHFGAEMPDGPGEFHKRIVVTDGDEDGANVMILRNKVAVGGGEEGDHDVVMLRRMPADGAQSFAFATGDGELPAIPLPVEATIARLQASAKFQQLDDATRATVLEALRESAPKAGARIAGTPGAKTIVLEVQDEDESSAAH